MDHRYNERIISNCKIDPNCELNDDCWKKYHDDQVNSYYWFNKITGEATWMNPTKKVKQENIMAYSLPIDNKKSRTQKRMAYSLPIDNKKSRTQKQMATI